MHKPAFHVIPEIFEVWKNYQESLSLSIIKIPVFAIASQERRFRIIFVFLCFSGKKQLTP